MRRLLVASNYVPAAVFFGFSAFYIFQMLLSIAPSNPLSWQLYLSIAPLFNRAASLTGHADVATSAVVAAMLGVAGLMLGRTGQWRRIRFMHFHVALLIVFIGIGNEMSYSASTGPTPVGDLVFGLAMPDLSNANPAYVTLFLIVLLACARAHQSVIWSLRHPVRTVAPVSI